MGTIGSIAGNAAAARGAGAEALKAALDREAETRRALASCEAQRKLWMDLAIERAAEIEALKRRPWWKRLTGKA